MEVLLTLPAKPKPLANSSGISKPNLSASMYKYMCTRFDSFCNMEGVNGFVICETS